MGNISRRSKDSQIRIEKTVFSSADPLPVVAYVVENAWPTPVAVSLTDRIPDDVSPSDVGFRKQDAEDWTIFEDGTLVYSTTIEEGSVARTAVFVRHEPFPEETIERLEPELTAVEAIAPDGDAGADERDATGAPDEPARSESAPDGGATGVQPEAATDAPEEPAPADPGTAAGDGDDGTDDAADAPTTADPGTAAGDDAGDAAGAADGSRATPEAEAADELQLADPGDVPDEAGSAPPETRPDDERGPAGGIEGPHRAEPAGGTDAPSEVRLEASTIRIEATADDSEVILDGQGSGSVVGAIDDDRLGEIERRLDAIQDAVEQVDIEAINAVIDIARGTSAEEEVPAVLDELRARAKEARRALEDVRDHVDAAGAVARSPVDAASRARPAPTGVDPATADERAYPRTDAPNRGVRIEMTNRDGGVLPGSGTAGGQIPAGGSGTNGTARPPQYVDVREFAMEDDEYTFDELIALGSEIFSGSDE